MEAPIWVQCLCLGVITAGVATIYIRGILHMREVIMKELLSRFWHWLTKAWRF